MAMTRPISEQVKFTQEGAGAVERLASEKLREWVSVKDFGAVGDGVTDDTAAIQAAIGHVEALDYGSVYFPGGQYRVSSTLRIRSSGVCLYGDDHTAVRLIRSTDYGDTLLVSANDPTTTRLSNIAIKGISIDMQAEMNSGAHIAMKDVITCAVSDVYLQNGFISFDLEGVQNSSFINTDIKAGAFYGSLKSGSCFVRIRDANNPANETGELSFTDFNWTRTGAIDTPVEFGVRIEAADGIWFSNGHVFGADTELRITPQTTTTQLLGLHFDSVWFDQRCSRNIYISGNSTEGYGDFFFKNCQAIGGTTNIVEIAPGATALKNVQFSGGFYGNVNSVTGLEIFNIGQGDEVQIVGASVINQRAVDVTAHAIRLGSAPRNILISGCIIGNTVIASPFAVGISVGAVNQNINISGCHFHSCTQEISLPGSLRTGEKISGCSSTRTGLEQVAGAAVLAIPTVVEAFDVITNSATITDIQYGWEGRQIMFRSNGVTTTIGHNGGASGTLIRTTTGANIVLTTGQVVWLTYQARAGAWYART